MIKKYITSKTRPFEIITDSLTQVNINNENIFNAAAKKISEETGVPQSIIMRAYINNWYKIKGEWYYYKGDGYDVHFINELLGEVISEFFGLDTIHYNVAKLIVKDRKDEYGLVSKNFCDPNYIYKGVWDYGFPSRTDLSILENIRSICQSEEEYLLLLNDLKTFFMRDFYTSQLDRRWNNFLFKITPKGVRLAPLYDYEDSFEYMGSRYTNQIAQIDIENSETQSLLRNDPKFQELIYLIMQANILAFIKEVEERHRILIPSEDKEYYKECETERKRLILENRLIK